MTTLQTRQPLAGYQPNRGFSLIELMVSMAVALLIVVGMVAMYVNVSRTNTEMAKTNSLIDNGRLAVDLLAEDIAHAGFWGSYVPRFDDNTSTVAPTDTPTAAAEPCLAYSNANWTTEVKNNLIGLPIQVFGDTPGGCNSLVTGKKSNTDVLVVRRASNCVPGEPNCEADNASKVYFQSSRCDTEITADKRYVLSDTDTILTLRDCTTTAPKRKYLSNIYYVRTYHSTIGDGIPTLMRSRFDLVSGKPAQEAAVPLIEGIEGLVLELGLDAKSRCNTDVNYATAPTMVDPATCTVNSTNAEFNTAPSNRGDGVPEPPFVRCAGTAGCTSAQLTNAVAAKIYVLARTSQISPGYTDTKTYSLGGTTLGPFNDGYKRHVFQLTVRLNNVAGRRETP